MTLRRSDICGERMRFSLGSWRFWHICFASLLLGVGSGSEAGELTSQIRITLTNRVISDGVSGTNPKALPGAIVEYQAHVANYGQLFASNNVAVTTAVPSNLSLFVEDDGSDSFLPFVFIDGSPPSSLICLFAALADQADCIEFSDDGGASFNYQPIPDGEGVDSNITHVRFRLTGAMAPALLQPASFTVRFRMKVN